MSQYVEFYLKVKGNYVCINVWSQSSAVYDIVRYTVPYEEARAVTISDINAWITYVKEAVEGFKKNIESLKQDLERISSFNNSIEDKLQAIDEYKSDITEWEKSLENYLYAENFFYFLRDLIEIAEDTKWEHESRHIDANNYLYVGIECGYPDQK